MIAWLYLTGAILTEVFATTSLRMSTTGRRAWYLGVLGGYGISFSLLSLTLQAGMGLGVAYGIWSAVGVALTALIGRFVFQEAFTAKMAMGIALIIGGVLLIETGAGH